MQTLPFCVFDGFTAAASLGLSTDGSIDRRLLDLACAYDQAQRTDRPPARIGKITLKPAAIVSIMATAIEKAVVRSGIVHRADFRQFGLKDAEIDQHYQEAFLKAAQRHPALFLDGEVTA